MIRFIIASITIGSIIGILTINLFEYLTGITISPVLSMAISFVLTSITINVGGRLLYS